MLITDLKTDNVLCNIQEVASLHKYLVYLILLYNDLYLICYVFIIYQIYLIQGFYRVHSNRAVVAFIMLLASNFRVQKFFLLSY